VNWFGLEFALIMIGAFVVVQAAVSCAYLLDCYKEMALEVMVGQFFLLSSPSSCRLESPAAPSDPPFFFLAP
jgi:hypothetical protein